MTCRYSEKCGGCSLRNLNEEEYRRLKCEQFARLMAKIKQPDIVIESPIFIADGSRRRAEFAFLFRKGTLSMGFNAASSHELIDIDYCCSLTEKINNNLSKIKQFLQKICLIKINRKIKNKIQTGNISSGKIFITQAANGLDLLLEIEQPLSLEHRLEAGDFIRENPDIVRISVSSANNLPETIVENTKPYIDICGYSVFIPAGTFLQASNESQNALIFLVKSYLGDTKGNIADLFCGIGTFSYPLSADMTNKITAVDSSPELLSGFRQTLNALTIPNVEIQQKNLFKYPLTPEELKNFAAVIFDPPRAGAATQVAQIALMNKADKPQKIVAVSCNPNTFINDANTLIAADYKLTKTTMVDQFPYTNHYELVALFEKN